MQHEIEVYFTTTMHLPQEARLQHFGPKQFCELITYSQQLLPVS